MEHLGSSAPINKKGTEAYYLSHMEALSKENKAMKARLDQLDRENRDLKKSIYDLSVRFDMMNNQLGRQFKPFDIDSIAETTTTTSSLGYEFSKKTENGITDMPSDGSSSLGVDIGIGKSSERQFFSKFTLRGHTAAVYSVKFCNSGKFLASGGFDKSIRVWDFSSQSEIALLQEHTSQVSDLCWSSDDSELISGAFDRTVRLWDITKACQLTSYTTAGFVQSVVFHPRDKNIFFAANTQKHVLVFDKRTSQSIAIIENDSIINTIHVERDGVHILSGDSNGFIKMWDSRAATNISIPFSNSENENTSNTHAIDNSSNKIQVGSGLVDSMNITDISEFNSIRTRSPISHIHISPNIDDDNRRFLGVNSYDNILRIYDRGVGISASKPVASLSTMPLINTVSGHKNKNWPIKSSFFQGRDYQMVQGKAKDTQVGDLKEEDEEDEYDGVKIERSIHESLLIATGSADNCAYIYDVSLIRAGVLLNRLEAHTDRVYAVNFHPVVPILAFCSADFTVRIWSPKKKIYPQ
eukprot:TRINITY_DN4430_c0_g1_i1.p1 TRINITY_DN4430_c0_g1~~TRINITY_DN4430_c0_g1_i1.p1  ORF type:complete len:525 (-),score=69.72 TRINITY_DN4430_c0_g1_i1:32-1606(-)